MLAVSHRAPGKTDRNCLCPSYAAHILWIAMDPECTPEDVQTALNKVMGRTRAFVKILPPISLLDSKVWNEDLPPPHALMYLQ